MWTLRALLLVALAVTVRASSYRLNAHDASKLGVEHVHKAQRIWDSFKQQHDKNYESHEEERARFSIYADNSRFIDEHNAKYERGEVSHRVRINHMADYTQDEYRRLLGFKRRYGDSLAKSHASTYLSPFNMGPLPTHVDWRDHGMVTPVKNQGMCGSCWSFSATGALEGQHRRRMGKLVSLSEQNLIDCSTSYGNQGCNGGLMDQAFQYVQDNQGIDTEVSYPYQGKDEPCRFRKRDVGATDTGHVDVEAGSETKLMEAIATVGPVSIAIDASQRSFQFYHHDVYIEPNCSSTELDHGVLAVGYGTSQDGKDYWIVKNSWGTSWGEDGYVRMARNRSNQCGVATAASYPLV